MSLKGRSGRGKESEEDVTMEAGSQRYSIIGFEGGGQGSGATAYWLSLETGKASNRFSPGPPERIADLPTPDFSRSPESDF